MFKCSVTLSHVTCGAQAYIVTAAAEAAARSCGDPPHGIARFCTADGLLERALVTSYLPDGTLHDGRQPALRLNGQTAVDTEYNNTSKDTYEMGLSEGDVEVQNWTRFMLRVRVAVRSLLLSTCSVPRGEHVKITSAEPTRVCAVGHQKSGSIGRLNDHHVCVAAYLAG